MKGLLNFAALWTAALAGGLALAVAVGAPPAARAQDTGDDGVHLGVASCAGNNCHGASAPTKNASVRQDEYLIWSQETDTHRIDQHHQAFTVLLGDRGVRIAHNLGLPDAATAKICLDCHADNVPEDRRGRQFRISDGVGCEACHGGAAKWLGTHLTGAGHQANLRAGLYPTEQPIARAERCLSCHLGDGSRRMTHQIMGAGHPPLPFELDNFTAIQPAHFVVDKGYIERKGLPNGAQIWAVGQAITLARRMDRLIGSQAGFPALDPDLMLFDCQSCHHGVDQLQWTPGGADGLGPGALRLYDANAVMLRAIAARVAPASAAALSTHLLAMHRATREGWPAIVREAAQLRDIANQLVPVLAAHEFSRDDMNALAAGAMSVALDGQHTRYSDMEQTTMALEAIVAAMRSFGYLSDDTLPAIDGALDQAYRSLADTESYRPAAFAQAIGDLQKVMPQ